MSSAESELKKIRDLLQRRNRDQRFLSRAIRILNSSLDLNQVLVTVLNEMSQMLRVVGGSIWLRDQGTGEMACIQSAGEQSDVVRGWRLAPGTGVVGWVAAEGKSVTIRDTREDRRHFKKIDKLTGLEIRSILCVPLKLRGRIIGTLQAVDSGTDRFNRDHLKMLEGLADHAAVSIENARLYEKAKAELAERRKTERILRKREKELEVNALNLKEANTALKVLLKRRDEDKIEFEERILFNVKELIEPYFDKIKRTRLNENQRTLVEILESNLLDIISPFARRLTSKFLSLTPKEIQIANLIKQGKTTKDIAGFLGVSNRTVDTHRKNLRIKLGIDKKRANLRTHLLSIQ